MEYFTFRNTELHHGYPFFPSVSTCKKKNKNMYMHLRVFLKIWHALENRQEAIQSHWKSVLYNAKYAFLRNTVEIHIYLFFFFKGIFLWMVNFSEFWNNAMTQHYQLFMSGVRRTDFTCRFRKSVFMDFAPTYELTHIRFGLQLMLPFLLGEYPTTNYTKLY